jgi:endonuclease YncB( thermonuclease family)
LVGIDSPEIRDAASRDAALRAKQALADVLRPDCARVECTSTCKAIVLDPVSTGSRHIIEVAFEGCDKYGRHLARLYDDGDDCINERLLSQHPTLFKRYLP